ncbi:MAG TPA: LicD family protein [Thermomonas sp.]|nr:LicD family protein [Thermomonas sp.]
MASLQLEVRVLNSPELAAHGVLQAIRATESGDREVAARGYRAALATRFVHPDSWSNLAALAIGLEDPQAARQHAMRAVQLDARHADAWVNLGVASWHAGQRREGAQAMHQALLHAQGMEAAALNYALMLRVVGRLEQAHAILAAAVQANPGQWRLHLALADMSRLLERHDIARRHVLAALDAMPIPARGALVAAPAAPKQTPAEGTEAVSQVLLATADALQRASLPFHLIGGTLLALYRDGDPFPHDKDIDLGMSSDLDRDLVQAALADAFTPMVRPGEKEDAASREWVMGFIHPPTGIGVDLMFMQPRGDLLRFQLGWPDHLACEIPAYGLQALAWRGREWSVPSPPEDYLAAIYGPDWNGEVHGRGFDRRYFDTQVSNPSRSRDSLPRALTLGMLRLVEAVRTGQWMKADALGQQILAREDLPEVRRLRARLPRPTMAPA